ncbi:MAG TPA: TfoX/Sxy family protein [Rhizomicrobium sp.]|nr:TfoX/Sxy family protein [Rhizomicrobium sp.]
MAAGDPDRFDDLFAPFGTVTVRRMFGGEGLYRDNVMFGIVFEERIYFKTNEEGRQAFIAEGCVPFVYPMKKGDIISHNYYALPDRLYDNPDELAEWARTAFAVAKTAPAGKKRRGAVKKKTAGKRR